MMAKWYQYAISPDMPGSDGEDLRHAHRQRHRAAGASGDGLADRLLERREVDRGQSQASRRPALVVLIAK